MKDLARAEIETSNPKRVLITYDVGGQPIESCTVSRDAVRDAFVMPWTLADFDGAFNDESSRKPCGAALLLAMAQPELEAYIAVTKDQ
ncbi:hypothetical protein [Burkholderia pseudomallei]|uniref:hypothetical protein n=1 Tax=Burkholderia pseudomallei TaxID=28450 RepID=UPI00135D221B|nr:hypothetical protein [Burkholderia pseudomallei]MWA35406.1 hypothetical protein [Burkholderia pseudomallei]